MAKMCEMLQWWKDCCSLHDARAALVRQALGAPEEDRPRIWQRIEDMESARTLVLMALLAVVACVTSLFTGVWCYPSFFVSVFIPAIPQRLFSTTLIPVNALVLAVYHHAVAALTWQDLYHCVAMTVCWVVIRCVRINVKWDIFQTSLSYERDFMVLAESHMMFHKMLGSVYDAWCFCDLQGEICSSTPQLDLLLGAPGTSPKEDALRGVSLLDLAATDAERRRVENFFSSVAGSDAMLKLTASLSRVGSAAHQVEVCLSAVVLSRRACVDHRLKPAYSGEPISGGSGDRMIFVAVQVLEAEPPCAVVEAPAVVQRAVRFQEDVGQESAGTSGATAGENSGSLQALDGAGMRQTCVRNTFVEAAESEAETIFEEARAQLPERALSAPGLLCYAGTESSAGEDEEEEMASPSVRSDGHAHAAAATTRSSARRVAQPDERGEGRRPQAHLAEPPEQRQPGLWPHSAQAALRRLGASQPRGLGLADLGGVGGVGGGVGGGARELPAAGSRPKRRKGRRGLRRLCRRGAPAGPPQRWQLQPRRRRVLPMPDGDVVARRQGLGSVRVRPLLRALPRAPLGRALARAAQAAAPPTGGCGRTEKARDAEAVLRCHPTSCWCSFDLRGAFESCKSWGSVHSAFGARLAVASFG